MHRTRALTAACAALAVLATLAADRAAAATPAHPTPVTVPAPATGPAPASPGGRAAPTAITLLTGDRVVRHRLPDGGTAIGVEPAPGRENIGFLRDARAGQRGTELSVVPADAIPLLAAGRLDPRLFNLTELERHGFTDAAASLPLIITRAPAVPASAATTVRTLPSVSGAALRQDRRDRRRAGELWRWLAGRLTAPGAAARVWLDGRARPALDGTAPQIGAPAAWQAGYTGAGVTVGVLDTGIRADHPDLAGAVVEARDFTGTRPDAGDDVGHGTHVAGIIAGTGAASAGRYRGVAPDATLISGKVCAVSGCPESAIIAGLEWIAPRARVVNLSVSAGSSDGTDPLSQAVNTLTARHGTLFVAAAGNGDPVEPVGAPAVADAALAVASVDRQDATSASSSRGPRPGDHAVKPDLAAPGEGVVAARAPGTPVGDAGAVDGDYTVHSGTSTAAPHVTAAAAILAQQHPDWTAGQLKAALMSTAHPTAGVYEQGAGRVDLARATGQPVRAGTGSLSFGFLPWPHQGRVSRTVTYHNDSPAPVTLTLRTAATGPDGQPAPAGLFTTTGDQVSVPAHGTAEVGVTVDPAAGGTGRYGGRLTATAGGVTVHTALGVVVEPESYDLAVRVTGRGASFEAAVGQVVDTRTGAVTGLRFTMDGTATVRLPTGRYDINVFDLSTDPSDQDQPFAVTLLSRPGVPLGAPVSVRLDATAGRPVATRVDRPDARHQFGELGIVSTNPAGDRGGALAWTALPHYRLFAVPTAGTVTDHPYAVTVQATLAATRPGSDPTGYVYHLAFVERGRIPARLTFASRDRDLATVDSRYHIQGTGGQAQRADIARLAVPTFGLAVTEVYPHTLPSRRTEYYTAGPDVTWQHLLAVFPPDQSDVEVNWSTRVYRPGRQQAGWNRAPLGPAFGDPVDGWGVFRAGDQLAVGVPLLSGSDPTQYTSPPFGMTGTTTLSRDGVELGSFPAPGLGAFPLPATPGRYTLRCTAVRAVPWSVLGTSAEVSWTFDEPGAAAAPAPLPLFVVRASGEVDAQGRAPAGRAYLLSLVAQAQPGAAPPRLTSLRVETSLDDGRTWRPAAAVRLGGHGLAVVRHPAGTGFVSLRVAASDATGSTVTQTVTRAYQYGPTR